MTCLGPFPAKTTGWLWPLVFLFRTPHRWPNDLRSLMDLNRGIFLGLHEASPATTLPMERCGCVDCPLPIAGIDCYQ